MCYLNELKVKNKNCLFLKVVSNFEIELKKIKEDSV